MGFKARKQLRFGPFRVNLTQRGLSSVSFKVGRFTHNFKTGRNTIDTPGPGSYSWGGKSRQRDDTERAPRERRRVEPEEQERER